MGGTISSGKNDGFGGLSLVDQFFQLETHFPTRNTEVPTVTFRLAVSSDLPKRQGPFEGNPNREQSRT